MKRLQSLKLDLIVDLSLLTFCALVLSEGLLILLLRLDISSGLGEMSPAFLKSVHQNFIHSQAFETALNKNSTIDTQKLTESFHVFASQQGLDSSWPHVNLIPIKKDQLKDNEGVDSVVSDVSRTFIFFTTVTEYRYLSPEVHGVHLEYRWSLHAFQSALTHFKWKAFAFALFIEVVLVIVGYFVLFKRNVLMPIDNLSAVSKSFLNGDWSVRCQVERQDELGQVAEALNEMARKIQEKEKKLVLTIESLKKANEEIEAAQTEQLQIEKLASIGRLAAGVAHEVGNPLGAISGYIDILRRAMKSNAEMSAEDIDLLDRIENETNRISKIIRALLQQARPTQERVKSVKLKPVLVRSVSLAQIPSAIDVSYEFDDDDAEVMAEEDQLVQVFLNLCMNARHAIDARKDRKEAGRLKIRCNSRKLPVYRSSGELGEYDTSMVRALKPETYWVVSFEDNGTGIKEEDQKKLFEPFFSTKAPGKGTGLGLYVTKSIIESFRGAIVVRSAVGYGTTFSIFLPKSSRYAELATS